MPIDSLLKDAGVHLDWQYLVSIRSSTGSGGRSRYLFTHFIKEPRQFQQCAFLFMALVRSSILLSTEVEQLYSA